MDSYRKGLNYVPMLTQNISPPCSGRSRISLNMKRLSQNSLMNYNGNYEGDNSMFSDKGFEVEHLNLMDSESDIEDTIARSSAGLKEGDNHTALVWRLVKFLVQTFLKPELSEKISVHIEKFRESSFYSRLSKWSTKIAILFSYIFYIAAILCKHVTSLGNLLWRKRVIFYNLARRLLWRLTLAKCNDLSLFALILLSIPVLFTLSVIGFFISVCGCFKDALNRGTYILNKI